MAIPKTLKDIDTNKARKLIVQHTNAGTGYWEGSPYHSDFIYKSGKGYKIAYPKFGEFYKPEAAKNDKKKKSRFGGLSDYLRKRKEAEIEDGG